MKMNLSLLTLIIFSFVSLSPLKAEAPKAAEMRREEIRKRIDEAKAKLNLEELRVNDPAAYREALNRLGNNAGKNAGEIEKLPTAEREAFLKAEREFKASDELKTAAERNRARDAYFAQVSNLAFKSGTKVNDISIGEVPAKSVPATKAAGEFFSASRDSKAGKSEAVPEASTRGKTNVTAEALTGKLNKLMDAVPSAKKDAETAAAAKVLGDTIAYLDKAGKPNVKANTYEAINGLLAKANERLENVPPGADREALLKDLQDILVRPLLDAARKSASPEAAKDGVLSLDALLRHPDLNNNPAMLKRVAAGLGNFSRQYRQSEFKRVDEVAGKLHETVMDASVTSDGKSMKVKDLVKAIQAEQSPGKKLRMTNELMDRLQELAAGKELSEAVKAELKAQIAEMNKKTLQEIVDFVKGKLGEKEAKEFLCNCAGAGVGAVADGACQLMGGTPVKTPSNTIPSGLNNLGRPPVNHGAQPPAIAP